jgi:YbbR domain-containing protein
MTTFLQTLILKDFWLKLFSLGLAALIWFTVNIAIQNQVSPVVSLPLGKLDRRTFSGLPVVVMSSAEDSRSFRVNPKSVDVTIEGDAKVLKSLYDRDIRVIVDLTGVEAAHDMRKRIQVSAPSGVSHIKIDPEEVQIIFPPKS